MFNAYKVVQDFEEAVADYCDSKYAVAVDSCSNAIFLCCKFLQVNSIVLPSKTYPSVPCSVIHAGGNVVFEDFEWREQGYYKLAPYPIYDAAHLFRKDMCKDIALNEYFICISFSATKPINIGKGGMILTDNKESVNWFKQARYCGRHEVPLMKDNFDFIGWNMYMTPEQAARGLLLMNDRSGINLKKTPLPEYPDLSKFSIYQSQS